MRSILVGLSAISAALVSVFACGTSPIAVDSCRSIEAARCQWATACHVSLSTPVRRDDSTNGVDDCIRYYSDACLHGIVSGTDPGQPATDACIAAINSGNCDIVRNPEKSPACAWLLVAPVADAATTDSADAASE